MPIRNIKAHNLRQHHRYEVSKPGADRIEPVTANVADIWDYATDETGQLVIPDDPHGMFLPVDPQSRIVGDTKFSITGDWHDG